MSQDTSSSVVLLSLWPCYADAILRKEKRVEFRKVSFRRPVSHAVMYSTHPVKHIVGFFEIARVEESSPRQLWRKYKGVAGVSKSEFDSYYEGIEQGVALVVRNVRMLRKPLPLRYIGKNITPPQSFRYFDEKILHRLRAA